MRVARGLRWWVALGVMSVLVLGPSAVPSLSAARTRTVLNLGPLTLQEATQMESVVSITNVTDGSRQVEVKLYDAAGIVVDQERLSVGPGDSGQSSFSWGASNTGTVRARVTASGTWLRGSPVSMSLLDGDGGPTQSFVTGETPAVAFSGEDLWTVYATGPIVHVVPEHALRIGVTNLGRSSAAFSTGLIGTTYGGDGPSVVTTLPNLAPGTTAWATFPSSATADVRPAVDGPDGSRALVTAELFEEATGEVVTTVILDITGY